MEISCLPECRDLAAVLSRDLERSLRLLDLSGTASAESCFLQPPTHFDLILVDGSHLSQIRPFLSEWAQNTLIALIEVANAGDVEALFAAFIYIEKISTQPSVYFCSNTHWYARGDLQPFDAWSNPSDFIPGQRTLVQDNKNSRRYYFTRDKFLKRYQGNVSAQQKEELKNEIDFLSQYAGIFKFMPKILQFSLGDTENWMLRERVIGVPLADIIQKKMQYNPRKIISDILAQLVALESYGFYHTDLRVWNVILTETGEALLIDYGAIKRTTRDISHKKNVFFTFILFCYEVIQKNILDSMIFNPAYFNSENYPHEYRGWLQNILSIPFEQWSFKLFTRFFSTPEPLSQPLVNYLNNMQRWISKTELRFYALKASRCGFFRLRYFEERFFRYFETHFIKKQFIELTHLELINPDIPSPLQLTGWLV